MPPLWVLDIADAVVVFTEALVVIATPVSLVTESEAVGEAEKVFAARPVGVGSLSCSGEVSVGDGGYRRNEGV